MALWKEWHKCLYSSKMCIKHLLDCPTYMPTWYQVPRLLLVSIAKSQKTPSSGLPCSPRQSLAQKYRIP